MTVMRNLFAIVVAISLVILLFVSVQGGSGDRQCFFVGECQYDDRGVPYRYYNCRGAYAAYSEWRVDMMCTPVEMIETPQG